MPYHFLHQPFLPEQQFISTIICNPFLCLSLSTVDFFNLPGLPTTPHFNNSVDLQFLSLLPESLATRQTANVEPAYVRIRYTRCARLDRNRKKKNEIKRIELGRRKDEKNNKARKLQCQHTALSISEQCLPLTGIPIAHFWSCEAQRLPSHLNGSITQPSAQSHLLTQT